MEMRNLGVLKASGTPEADGFQTVNPQHSEGARRGLRTPSKHVKRWQICFIGACGPTLGGIIRYI